MLVKSPLSQSTNLTVAEDGVDIGVKRFSDAAVQQHRFDECRVIDTQATVAPAKVWNLFPFICR